MTRSVLRIALPCLLAAGLFAGAAILRPAGTHAGSTTTTTTTTLTARQIISEMRAAEIKQNSLHIVFQLHLSMGSGSVTAGVTGDASLHPQLFSGVVTAQTAGSGQSTVVDVDAVGNQVAARRDNGSWMCKSTQSFQSQYLSVMKTLNPQVQSADLVGADTVDGISVWHVHATMAGTMFGASQQVPVDFYISQADLTLVREQFTADVQSPAGQIHMTGTADLSQYGEAVHVTLPAACAAPIQFAIQRLAVENPSWKPDWTLKRPSLTRAPVGTKIQVAVYVKYPLVRQRVTVHECQRVWRNGKKVFSSCDHDTPGPGRSDDQQYFADSFTPWHTGRFRLTTTVWSGSQTVRKTIWFRVVRGR